MTAFSAYGLSHCIVLSLTAAAAVGLIVMGRRLRGTPAERRFARGLAILILLNNAANQIYAMLPHVWGLGHSLPLELCDLTWMAAVVALWTRSPWACALVYYWGLTLTLQALLTPRLEHDFPALVFLMFFSTHALTVLAAIYLTWGDGTARPTWRLWAFTLMVTLGYAAALLAFNTLAGTNYMFLNAKPKTASLLDVFGPWPYYLLVGTLVGAAAWALITWPWYWRITPRGHVSGDLAATKLESRL